MGTSVLQALGRGLRSMPPAFKGKARLARALMGPGRDAHDVLIDMRDGSRMLVPSLAEPIGFHLFVDGVYEPQESAWILDQLKPGDVYVDVGANIGGFVVPVSKKVGPGGRVIAIEASARVASYLQRNIDGNRLENVTLVQQAAADQTSASRPFYDAPDGRFGSGGFAGEQGYSATEVRATTLDAVLADCGVSRVAVLKVDVEGFEAAVFRGAFGLLTGPNPPLVLFEFYDWAERRAGTPGDAQRVLQSAGYELWRFEDFRPGVPPLRQCLTGEPGGNLIAAPAVSRP